MAHSKYTKRGKSLYVESWNPDAKRFINECKLCGATGYRPSIDDDGFIYDASGKIADFKHRAIRDELQRIMKPLWLDELGRCRDCAARMDTNKN